MQFSVRQAAGNGRTLWVCVFSVILLVGLVRGEVPAPRLADFEDVIEKSGLTMMNVFGGVH